MTYSATAERQLLAQGGILFMDFDASSSFHCQCLFTSGTTRDWNNYMWRFHAYVPRMIKQMLRHLPEAKLYASPNPGRRENFSKIEEEGLFNRIVHSANRSYFVPSKPQTPFFFF